MNKAPATLPDRGPDDEVKARRLAMALKRQKRYLARRAAGVRVVRVVLDDPDDEVVEAMIATRRLRLSEADNPDIVAEKMAGVLLDWAGVVTRQSIDPATMILDPHDDSPPPKGK